MRIRLLSLAFCLLIPMAGFSANLAFFDNPAYTDPPEESANLIAALEAAGHNVSVFSGITAADWATALASADGLVIPELDSGALEPALDQAAKNVIAAFVSSGHGFIGISSNRNNAGLYHDVELWNAVFGFSLVHTNVSQPFTLQVASGRFAGLPATLADLSAVEGVTAASLPAGAEIVYTDTGGNVVVFAAPYGTGNFIQIGYDWFAASSGADPDDQAAWDEVLPRAIEVAAAPATPTPPVPTTGFIGLLVLVTLVGTIGLLFARREG